VAQVARAKAPPWLKTPEGFDRLRPVLTSEFQLEQKHRLVKLLG
jgi:hypothetical protein